MLPLNRNFRKWKKQEVKHWMDKKPTVYIRADANETIGTGHVMRCLSIGEAIRKQGGDAVFLAADSRTEDIVRSRGFSVICLDSVWDDLEKELDRLVSWIRQKSISVLLIDSYYVTPYYLETLRRHTKLAYIDDLNAFAYPVDLLIRYAVYSRQPRISEQPQILSGSRYIPLKSEFCGLPERKISKEVKNILVLTGGTDPYHVALEFVKYLADTKSHSGQQFHIICGKYNPDYEELCRLASGLEQVSIHYNVQEMADFMLAADLAVTAGGTTTYELCACGTPSVCYILADNQIQNARTLAEKGFMLFGGDVREKDGFAGIIQQFERLSKDMFLRKEMSEKMQQLVDGRGAERIAQAICQNL